MDFDQVCKSDVVSKFDCLNLSRKKTTKNIKVYTILPGRTKFWSSCLLRFRQLVISVWFLGEASVKGFSVVLTKGAYMPALRHLNNGTCANAALLCSILSACGRACVPYNAKGACNHGQRVINIVSCSCTIILDKSLGPVIVNITIPPTHQMYTCTMKENTGFLSLQCKMLWGKRLWGLSEG